ncbi:hypothetical protein DFJ58DRAFT_430434 [Suillus subalutaceus]|uniref:uncharacterized protein n=1 Tax=Suillus subalutaceus TaxID=48586 RepID=UPI001B860AA1|nr:uncharacterized protein DFJ58DRAFT_430434 [Suillus subalutaceus]KAG1850822.1 hypothetical protein DFJ58DRAFT_430434 [Suillus subalutaceus]
MQARPSSGAGESGLKSNKYFRESGRPSLHVPLHHICPDPISFTLSLRDHCPLHHILSFFWDEWRVSMRVCTQGSQKHLPRLGSLGPEHTYFFPHPQTTESVCLAAMEPIHFLRIVLRNLDKDLNGSFEGCFYVYIWDFNKGNFARLENIDDTDPLVCMPCR